jgi:hypothetical protein
VPLDPGCLALGVTLPASDPLLALCDFFRA